MADFDERKTPLTLDNIRVWADAKFPRAFRALPGVAKVSFLEFDDAKFESDRSIERSIKRSEHKKLLMIGKYAPESEDEEEFACAIVHANDYNVSYYRSVGSIMNTRSQADTVQDQTPGIWKKQAARNHVRKAHRIRSALFGRGRSRRRRRRRWSNGQTHTSYHFLLLPRCGSH